MAWPGAHGVGAILYANHRRINTLLVGLGIASPGLGLICSVVDVAHDLPSCLLTAHWTLTGRFPATRRHIAGRQDPASVSRNRTHQIWSRNCFYMCTYAVIAQVLTSIVATLALSGTLSRIPDDIQAALLSSVAVLGVPLGPAVGFVQYLVIYTALAVVRTMADVWNLKYEQWTTHLRYPSSSWRFVCV